MTKAMSFRTSLAALGALFLFALPASTQDNSTSTVAMAQQAQLVANYGQLPLSFEANQGQSDAQVRFLARGRGYTLFLTEGEALLALTKGESKNGPAQVSKAAGDGEFSHPTPNADVQAPVFLGMKLVGANPAAEISGLDELPGKSNYFIGNDPKKWTTDVPNYAKVQYQSVYPGVDLVYYGNQGKLEYDFVVAPGGDARAIVFDLAGAVGELRKRPGFHASLRIARDGDLVVRLNSEEIRLHKPVAYQASNSQGQETNGGAARQLVEAHYVLKSKTQVGIRLGAYDPYRSLVIDPVLIYSSYLGGSGTDNGDGIAVDPSGNAYVTGYTNSTNYPTVNQIQGACEGTCGSGTRLNAFVTKINAAGNAIVYSSYIGGGVTGQNGVGDFGNSITVDSSGNAYLTGYTDSSNFPRVNQIAGACQGTCGSGNNNDGFVAKINAAGNALIYSSLIGGSGDDEPQHLTIDGSGNAYLTGFTSSQDYPLVSQIPGACLGTCGNGTNYAGLFTKIDAAGNALVYSSLIGGSGVVRLLSIALGNSGNIYIAGETMAPDFPRVNQIPGACNGTCGTGANMDAVALEINASASALIYSSYLGGSGFDDAEGVVLDAAGNAHLTGTTVSADFPRLNQIPGFCVSTCGTGANADVFVLEINEAGNSLIYSTYIGGSGDDDALGGLALDSSGNIYVNGATTSPDFVLGHQIPGACLGTCPTKNNEHVFLLEIAAPARTVVYSSFLGGSGYDVSGVWNGVALDPLDNVYLTGGTTSPDFPRLNQISGACNGTCGTGAASDAFVMKISAAQFAARRDGITPPKQQH